METQSSFLKPFAIVIALAALLATTVVQAAPANEKSLYERLGGVFAIAAVVDHFSDKPLNLGGLAQGRFDASVVLAVAILIGILLIPQRAGQHPGTDQKARLPA